MFLNLREVDPESLPRQDAFKAGVGRSDVEYYVKFGGGDYARYDQIAQELIDLNPDLLVATCGPTFWALQQRNPPVPIVFTTMIDPARTGRTIGPKSRGIASYQVSLAVQWLRLLKQMAPHIERVAVVADLHANRPAAREEMVEIRGAAGAMVVENSIDLNRNDEEVAGAIAAFAKGGNGGLIVPTGTLAGVRRKLIIDQAAAHRLPAIYGNRLYVKSGGLFCYGPKTLDLYREAGECAARILNNQPTLPPGQAQMNNRFELVINRRAAALIGLPVPQALLAQADEVLDGG
jgi:putative ABC transport system substrate-binding protein